MATINPLSPGSPLYPDNTNIIEANFSALNNAKLETLQNVGDLINTATSKTTPVDSDMIGLMDSAGSNILKKLSWLNIKATLKTYFDTLYQVILVSGTNIKTINGQDILGSGDIEITSGGGGGITPVYLTNLTSTTNAAYKQSSYTPDVAETIVSTVVNNNEVLAQTYIYDADVGLTTIDAGTWTFNVYSYVSSTPGTTTFRLETFKRTSGGVETTLFSVSSGDINDTTRTLHTFNTTQGTFAVNATDRLGTRVYVNTTANVNITVSYVVGDGNASFFTTPLKLRASQIRNTPAGNISSTDVQGAINELDSEKVAKSGDTMTGNLVINSTSGTALEVNVGGGGTDVLFKNTNNDIILNLETTLANKASYINMKSTSNYNGFWGFVNGIRKFFIGKQNDSDGIGIYVSDGYTKSVAFKDDRTTQFFGQISATNLSGTNTGDQDLSGLMVKSSNLSDVLNQQTALNNITAVSGATNEYVLTKDTATGNAIWKIASGGAGLSWGASISGSSGIGLSLTASSGATGGISTTISNSSSAPTNAWNYLVLGNTQSVAHTMMKIDTGTSAQGHTGILINTKNGSSGARGIKIDITGGSAYGLEITGNGGSQKILTFGNASSFLNDFGINPGSSAGHIFATSSLILSGLIGRSSDYFTISTKITHTSGANTNDGFNLGYIKRETITTSSSYTTNSTGSVLKLENIATQTSGTLNDSVSVLLLSQGINTTGSLITMTSGNTNSRAIDFATNLTSATAPTGASTYINIKINGVAHKILAQAV